MVTFWQYIPKGTFVDAYAHVIKTLYSHVDIICFELFKKTLQQSLILWPAFWKRRPNNWDLFTLVSYTSCMPTFLDVAFLNYLSKENLWYTEVSTREKRYNAVPECSDKPLTAYNTSFKDMHSCSNVCNLSKGPITLESLSYALIHEKMTQLKYRASFMIPVKESECRKINWRAV